MYEGASRSRVASTQNLSRHPVQLHDEASELPNQCLDVFLGTCEDLESEKEQQKKKVKFKVTYLDNDVVYICI